MPPKKFTLGFIGAGRVGTGLASSFARAGVKVVAIASRKIASALRLAKRVRGARACAPQEVADRADLVFLTVPDDASEAVAPGIKWRPGPACVPSSGAADPDVLRTAAELGGAAAVHAGRSRAPLDAGSDRFDRIVGHGKEHQVGAVCDLLRGAGPRPANALRES